MNSGLLIAALLSGLFGSTHCALMCGGIASSLGSNNSSGGALVNALKLNAARVAGYSIAGLLVGIFGSSLLRIPEWSQAGNVLRALIGCVLLLLAWRIAFPQRQIFLLSKTLRYGWSMLQPLTKVMQKLPASLRTIGFGLLWAFLPCGLSSTLLLAAWLTADPVQSASIMLAFGLGTLPVMTGISWSGTHFANHLRQPAVRASAASIMSIFAGAMITAPLLVKHNPVLEPALRALGCIDG